MITAWGYKPGPWFPAAIEAANAAQRAGGDVRAAVDALAPPRVETVGLRPHGGLSHYLNICAEDPDEVENVAAVERHLRELMRAPTIVAGAVMPDACPAGAARALMNPRRGLAIGEMVGLWRVFPYLRRSPCGHGRSAASRRGLTWTDCC